MWHSGKESTCNPGDQVLFLGQEDPLEEETATPVYLPRKFHGQRSLVGYSPWVHKESDMTEVMACDGSKAVGLPFKI